MQVLFCLFLSTQWNERQSHELKVRVREYVLEIRGRKRSDEIVIQEKSREKILERMATLQKGTLETNFHGLKVRSVGMFMCILTIYSAMLEYLESNGKLNLTNIIRQVWWSKIGQRILGCMQWSSLSNRPQSLNWDRKVERTWGIWKKAKIFGSTNWCFEMLTLWQKRQ